MQSQSIISLNASLNHLPNEIVKEIISLLQDKDIIALSKTSRRFNKLCEQFFNSFYGKAMRFDLWQRMQFQALNSDIKSFSKEIDVAYDVCELEQQNLSHGINQVNVRSLNLKVPLLLLLSFATYCFYDYIREPNTKSLALSIILASTAFCVALLQQQPDIAVENSHRMSTLDHELRWRSTKLSVYPYLIATFNKIVKNDFSHLFNAVHSLYLPKKIEMFQAKPFLSGTMSEMVYLNKEFKDYIRTKRLKAESYLDSEDLTSSKENDLSKYKIVLFTAGDLPDNLDAIVIKIKFNGLYVTQIGDLKRNLRLDLTHQEISNLQFPMSDYAIVKVSPQLFDKIVKQCSSALVGYVTQTVTFWQNQHPRSSNVSSNIVELDNELINDTKNTKKENKKTR